MGIILSAILLNGSDADDIYAAQSFRRAATRSGAAVCDLYRQAHGPRSMRSMPGSANNLNPALAFQSLDGGAT